MSQIVGEINMDHGQKGGVSGATAAVAAGLIGYKLYNTELFNIAKMIKKAECNIIKNIELQLLNEMAKEMANTTDDEKPIPFLHSIHGIMVTFYIKKVIELKGDLPIPEPKPDKGKKEDPEKEKIRKKKEEELNKIIEELIQTIIRSLKKEFGKEKKKKCSSEHWWGEINEVKLMEILGIEGANRQKITDALKTIKKIANGEIVNEDDMEKIIKLFEIIKTITTIIKKVMEIINKLNAEIFLIKLIKKENNGKLTKKDLQLYIDDPDAIFYHDMCEVNFKNPLNRSFGLGLPYAIHNSLNFLTTKLRKTRGKMPALIHVSNIIKDLKLIPCYTLMDAIIKDIIEPIKIKINAMGENLIKLINGLNIAGKIVEILTNTTNFKNKNKIQSGLKTSQKGKVFFDSSCCLDWKDVAIFPNDEKEKKEEQGEQGEQDDEENVEYKREEDMDPEEKKTRRASAAKNKKDQENWELRHGHDLDKENIVVKKKTSNRHNKPKYKYKFNNGDRGGKKKRWRGGALIGQGTFGCVFKPHLLCNGKQDFKDRKHVSKLIVMRSGDDYRLDNELDIGQLILKSKKYSKYFSPIISTCPIEFKHISDQDKYKCNSANKYMDNKMILAKLKKVNGTNVIDTFDNIRGTEAVYIFFDIYKDALEGIKFLTQKKIIHYDIKWDNILYDTKVKRGILIDFGLSFQIKYLKFDSLKKLKKYFYVFAPQMDVWCIEIHYICYLLNKNNNPDLYDITDMVNECISNNSLFKSEITRYFDLDKNTFYDNSISVLMNYQKDYPDILKRIKYIVNKFYKTWDNYSLSIMFLKQYDLILREKPNKFPKFHKKIITDILWKNIQPDPKKRLAVKKTITSFNKLYDNLNSSEFLELSKYA